MPTRWGRALALLLLAIFAAQIVLSVHRQSLSWDEGDHIFAGYQSWKAGEFGLNPEHPPLVKELATLPLLAMHLRTPPSKGRPFFKDEAYLDGRDLIYGNGGIERANAIIFRARLTAGVLSLLMAVLVYAAGREMFGQGAALFALALVAFEPNLIAHGAYVTTDMGITCFLFATVYALYRYRERPSWGRLAALGLATGLALATKHSAVLLLPIALALAAFEWVWPREGERRRRVAARYGIAFAGAAALGVAILWSTYGFRFSAHPGGVSMSPSLAEYSKPLHGAEPKIYLLLARLHALPESYLYGLVDIRILSVPDQSFPTYLLGQVHAHGVPYYFPFAFAVKSTLGFMLLLGVAAYAGFAGRFKGRRLAFLVLPPLVYLLIAMGTGLNIGARHILPMYPFLAVLIGGGVMSLWDVRPPLWRYGALLLLGWHIVSAARSYPVYLAYSNELFGGPAQTHRYLTDSNVDWGQQLLSVKKYVDEHRIADCWFGYFVQPSIDYRAYGIPCRQLPTANSMWIHQQVDVPPAISGTVLISASTLTGYEFGSVALSPFQPFMGVRPVDTIDHGVFVYTGTFDTRFASAFGYYTRATDLLAAKDLESALAAARQAVAIDAEMPQGQMILGDVLAALHRAPESLTAYDDALRAAGRMEPSARREWVRTVEEKQSSVRSSAEIR